MKIRGGFVSNSSSSSFLVIYSDVSDFDRFSKFARTADLIADLSKSTEEDVFGFIYQLILWDGYNTYFKYTHNWGTPHGLTESFSQIQDLVSLSGASDYEYLEWLQGIVAVGNKLYMDNDVANVKYVYDKEWYQEYVNAWYDKICKELDPIATKLAHDIAQGLSSSAKTAAYVTYEDHDEDEAYMEHRFMPMLAHDPDEKIFVITVSNH